MNRRKFLSYVGCGCCGFVLNSCSTAPITERRQLNIIPEAKLNAQAAQIYEKVKEKEKLSDDTQKLNEIYLRFPEFESFQRQNLERHLVSTHKRILNQLQLTALERYNLFLKQYPNIEQHVPNYHIASYLGITQQSLSRVRAEKVKK